MGFILGKKLKMSQIFKEDKGIPVTIIQAGPVVVTQVRTKEKDGYEAVQVGFGTKKAKNIRKPQLGQFKNLGNFQYLKEYKIQDAPKDKSTGQAGCRIEDFKVGDVLTVSQLKEGEKIKISGLSKGKGFQGVVKRYGFGGGPKTHGQKNRLRAPGSIGNTALQRVALGRRMAGRMGQEKIIVKNLEIVSVDPGKNILMVKGAVPGRKETLLKITSTKHQITNNIK